MGGEVTALSKDQLLEKVITQAKQQLPKTKQALVSRFIRLFYSHMAVDDLSSYTVNDLYGIALSMWELLRKRPPGESHIHVFNPHFEQHGWQSTHTVITLVTDDMPFVVDSVRMALDALGLTTHMTIYTGGLWVKRNQRHQVTAIADYESDHVGMILESPLYIEVDRQADVEALKQITERLHSVLNDIRLVVSDWQAMVTKLKESIKNLQHCQKHFKTNAIIETIAFLEWLAANHFTFLGARDYEVVCLKPDECTLKLVPGSGLGVLRDERNSTAFRHVSSLPPEARQQMLDKEKPLMISKTNTPPTVHRPEARTDYISVKAYDENGNYIGERRFVGLFTSTAYNCDPRTIPLVQNKVKELLNRSHLPGASHAGKDLIHILSTLPRDYLFQGQTDELYEICLGILHLQERRQTRLFVRKDAYGRFVSCLVFLPRENFNTHLLYKIRNILMEGFNGKEIRFSTQFSASVLARIHYEIWLDTKHPKPYDMKAIEAQVIEASRSWRDEWRMYLLEYFGEEWGSNKLLDQYQNAFSASYLENFEPLHGVYDVKRIEDILQQPVPELAMSVYRPLGAAKDVIKFKLYNADQTIPLSDALPMLENMGLRVVGEQPYRIKRKDGRCFWINDFNMTYVKEPTFEVEQVKLIFQEAFKAVWYGEAENDGFNRLVLEAQLTWREISLLRAYAKYMKQTGFTYSTEYIAETLVNHASVARLIVELFYAYFDPNCVLNNQHVIQELEEKIQEKFDEISSLDEDRILRRYLKILRATLRTNYFQVDASDKSKRYLAFKFDPDKVPELPLPRPDSEIFVFSPRVEGIHLRCGSIARGGIRLSDRREDFRTEVLGLMKAQQVKNALIVPAGAKGGFVPKHVPARVSKDEIIQYGIACYKEFISGLLDLTDNLVGDQIVSPTHTICYDDPDPYFVVAADKGTATFSDIANEISSERAYWLGDAFASGGANGYDHKGIGITARGAWVSARRHFQERGIDIDKEPITVVGVGDMSGDVFGNGVLLSSRLKLVAAFNHQHIFVDPNPDPDVSFKERQRLFSLPRSTWADYDKHLISEGGGVYSRHVKSIPIAASVKALLNIDADHLIPNELIKAILCAKVDLIWNGGVGTFVKASHELNADIGDRSNDNIRVNGNDLRARVVCEGGNLGLTQAGRIEYELSGGKVNADFIDNSAGVDCSDHEVNIKILLDGIVRDGDMTEKQRNNLLAEMTQEVAELVLHNNYLQNRVISFAAYLAPKQIGLYLQYINALESNGKINRELENLPDDKTLLERKNEGVGLTRPELSVLLAYSKILLEEAIRKSNLTEDSDPYLLQFVNRIFPTPLRNQYADRALKHRLAKEIISTQISNQLVSDMGITFVYQMMDETGADPVEIVRAYMIAHEIYHMTESYAEIESLDYQVPAEVQHSMVNDLVRLIRRATRWLLRNYRQTLGIEESISYFSDQIIGLYRRLPHLLAGATKSRLEARREKLISEHVPAAIALKLSTSSVIYHALNIIEAAKAFNADLYVVAKIYFDLVERLDLLWFRDYINSYPVEDRWSVLARSSYKGDLDWIQRQLTIGVLRNAPTTHETIDSSIDDWLQRNQTALVRWEEIIADMKSAKTKDFAMLAVAVRELNDLARMGAPRVEALAETEIVMA